MISIIIYIGILLLLLNTLLFSQRFFIDKKPLRIFIIYLFITLIIQITARVLLNNKIPNIYLSHFYFISQFLLLSLFYKKIIKSKTKTKMITITLFVVLASITYLFISNPSIFYKFSLFEVVICSIPLVIYSIFYFMESFGFENKKYLFFNSGLFIYLLSSTLIFSSGNLMENLPKDINRIVWVLNASLYLVYQILIFIEWYKNFRKSKLT